MGEELVKCCFCNKNEREILKSSIISIHKPERETKEEFAQTDQNGEIDCNRIYGGFGGGGFDINIVKNSDLVEQKKQISEKNETIIYEYPITNINIINSNLFIVDDVKGNNINISLVRDDFCNYLFKKINNIRTNPKSFIEVLKESKKNIIEEDDKFYYKQNNVKNKIRLKEGKKSFDDAISFLENLEKMDKLKFDNILNINKPKTKEDLKDIHYLINQVDNLIKKGIRIKCYWKIDDINIQDVCLLMMILDENNKNKEIRNSLLNKNMKKIGINSFTIDNSFACYILLSDR